MILTGALITCIDVSGTAAADQLLMIAQTEQSVGSHLTDTALADTGPRTEHAFWTRCVLRPIARISSIPRCTHTCRLIGYILQQIEVAFFKVAL